MGGGRIWWQLMKKKDTRGEEEVNKACLMFGAAVKLCLGDLLVMGSNPETVSLHMQG